MSESRKTAFVSVHLTPAARDELRAAALALTSPVGRRVSMSDVVLAAVHIAREHEREWTRLLADKP